MKNTKKVAFLFLLAVIAVGCYFVSGTYAKYTSSVSGTGDATVAKWKWTINNTLFDEASDISNGFTFDLFSTVKEADTTTTESDVASGKIAPGTGGSFDIVIENQSDVNAKYDVTLSETNTAGIPIEYSTNGSSWVSTVSSFGVKDVAINSGATSSTLKVYWRWAYQVQDANSDPATYATRDAADTAIGFAANSGTTLSVTANVTVTQVD